jgi:cytochrome c oxidase subunit 1
MTRLPLTIWALLQLLLVWFLFRIVICSAVIDFDRSFGTLFFLSDIYIAGEVLHYQGGSPVLFEHLFWFLGHPEVYIVLLPALGMHQK